MCILSFFRSSEDFILTHNRDEDFQRKTSETLFTKTINGLEVTYPVDLASGGTWILTSEKFTSAILNGAEHFHPRNPPYRHSRGLFPLMLLEFNQISTYLEEIALHNIEPFTQILIDHSTQESYELRWNGIEKTSRLITENFYVASSSTLYNETEKQSHLEAFEQLKTYTTDNLADMHKALQWTFKPNLPMIKTTSITQIFKNKEFSSMKFERMIKNEMS